MKRPLKIILYKSELIYDIQNKTALTARSRNTGENYEDVANMQANDDEENMNQILRSIGNAWTNLLSKLSEYVDVNIGDYDRVNAAGDPEASWHHYGDPNATPPTGTGMETANDKLFDEQGRLQAYLLMPDNYNEAAKDLIATAMHQYVVNSTLTEWFAITNKNDASDYATMAAANFGQLREALHRRKRPARRPV